MFWNLIHNAKVTDRTYELVSRGCKLSLKEREPENACLSAFQSFAYVMSLILVNYILEIDLVKIVCPGVQNLEAFIFHILCAVSLDVSFDKFKTGLEGDNRVLQIIFLNGFLGVFQEVRDGLDA